MVKLTQCGTFDKIQSYPNVLHSAKRNDSVCLASIPLSNLCGVWNKKHGPDLQLQSGKDEISGQPLPEARSPAHFWDDLNLPFQLIYIL